MQTHFYADETLFSNWMQQKKQLPNFVVKKTDEKKIALKKRYRHLFYKATKHIKRQLFAIKREKMRRYFFAVLFHKSYHFFSTGTRTMSNECDNNLFLRSTANICRACFGTIETKDKCNNTWKFIAFANLKIQPIALLIRAVFNCIAVRYGRNDVAWVLATQKDRFFFKKQNDRYLKPILLAKSMTAENSQRRKIKTKQRN